MNDTISRQAAIDEVVSWLKDRMTDAKNGKSLTDRLKDLPSAQPETDQIRWERDVAVQQLADLGYGLGEKPRTDEDTISRQAAIDALDVLCQEHRYKIPGKRETYSEYNEAWQDALDRAQNSVFNLPSVQSEHKNGHWISLDDFRGKYNAYGYKCSECNEQCDYEENFCPNCGAKMEG